MPWLDRIIEYFVSGVLVGSVALPIAVVLWLGYKSPEGMIATLRKQWRLLAAEWRPSRAEIPTTHAAQCAVRRRMIEMR
jgi:hypothetical protein